MKFLFLSSLFFALTQLFCADINTTIAKGDATLYRSLLQSIDTSSDSKSEANLQKTLLVQLMAKPKKALPHFDIRKKVTTQEEYRKRFELYIKNLLLLKALDQKIEANKQKQQALLQQIKSQQKPLLTTQLFYAFYLKKQKEESTVLQNLQEELKKLRSSLIDSVKRVVFEPDTIQKKLEAIHKQLALVEDSIEQLKIQKERYVLLQEEQNIAKVSKKIAIKEQKEQKLYADKLSFLFCDFSYQVKRESDKIMQKHKEILTLLKEDLLDGWMIVKDVDALLLHIEQGLLGSMETLKEQSLQELRSEVETFWKVVQRPLFVINKTPISTLKLILSLIIFIVGFFIGSLYKRYIEKLVSKNKSISAGSHILLANMGYYTIFLITFFIVLKVLGIDLSSIALVAGALSVGIGFGLQNVISNFVSGIILMVERSVKIGDYIELDNDLRGHVVDIKMRSITVNTNSNIDIIVPNQDLIQNRVINWTMNDKIRRFEIPFGVAYGTDPQKVISLILEAVQKSGFQDIYNTPERYTRVIMRAMGNSSVDFELFVWVKGKEILFPKRTTSRFLILIYNTLNENGIEIPFPQQDLHIRSVDVSLPVTLKDS